MSSERLSYELEQLDRKSLTTYVLSALDFVIPGSYQNATSLEDMVQMVTGDVRAGRLQAISNHVDQLYSENSGASRAIWLYQLTDSADKAVAAASLANKIGDKVGILSFLGKVTPKADTSQTIDLCLKLTAEALAHLSLHGLNRESPGQWLDSLRQGEDYSNESALRLAAIIGIDGLLPLGPNFLSRVTETLNGKGGDLGWAGNPMFKKLAEYIPGGDVASKTGFVGDLVKEAAGPIDAFVGRTGLSRDKVVGGLKKVTDFSDDKLDYVAAFLDASTNYMSHTGVQTVARYLVAQSAARFGYGPNGN
jgi:hypothetical protein